MATLQQLGVRACVALSLSFISAQPAFAQQRAVLPFGAGERLEYDARAGRLLSAHADMWVEGPVQVNGSAALLLRFRVATRVGPLTVSDDSWSWIDPTRMATLRFEKRERHLLARRTEEVDVDARTGAWRDADGRTGIATSSAPLDELSFIYALRAMPLPADSSVSVDRHFDAERNPTTLRVVGHDTVSTAAGTFATRAVEMRVRDARHYRGEGVIRIWISEDACARPVRIVSTIPDAGTVELALRRASPERASCGGIAIADSSR